MAEHLPYYGHEQGCYNSRIPWGPEPCPGCVALRRAFSRGQRDERERHANELDVAVAKARAEVVTVDLALTPCLTHHARTLDQTGVVPLDVVEVACPGYLVVMYRGDSLEVGCPCSCHEPLLRYKTCAQATP